MGRFYNCTIERLHDYTTARKQEGAKRRWGVFTTARLNDFTTTRKQEGVNRRWGEYTNVRKEENEKMREGEGEKKQNHRDRLCGMAIRRKDV